METTILQKLFTWLKTLPSFLRVLVSILVGIIVAIALLSSCGQTVRVTVKDTPNGVAITTSQSKQDSSATNININPNINMGK